MKTLQACVTAGRQGAEGSEGVTGLRLLTALNQVGLNLQGTRTLDW